MNIGNNIKYYRKQKGLTQEQLASKCNISKNGLWNYENNKRKPNIEILTDIAMALDISMSDLLDTQETLTSKLIEFIDKKLFSHCDADNTLELISELIDLDFDALSNAIKYDEDLSESYLSSMLKLIYKHDKKLFYEFYEKNKILISEKYILCDNLCDELINSVNVDKKFLEKVRSVAKEGQELANSWRNDLLDIENSPKRLLYTILNFLQNTDDYYSPLFIDILDNKLPGVSYLTDEQINSIVKKITELVKYEIYKIENNIK